MNNLWKPSNLTVLELRELEPEIIFAHFILAIFFRRSFEIIIVVLFAAFSLISNIWWRKSRNKMHANIECLQYFYT